MNYLTKSLLTCTTIAAMASPAWADPALVWAQDDAPLAVTNVTDVSASIDLDAIAAQDPSLSIREGQDGEADAMVMLSDVLFGFGKSELEEDALITLETLGKKLKGAGGLEITGHTDSIGDADRNEKLGMARAEAVRDWLVSSGLLNADDVTIASAGEADPIAPNVTADGRDDVEGRALNRRVEFSIVENDVASVSAPHPTVF